MDYTDFIIRAAELIVKDDYLNHAGNLQKEFKEFLKEDIENIRKLIFGRACIEHPELENRIIGRRVCAIFPDCRKIGEIEGFGRPKDFDLIEASEKAQADARRVLNTLSSLGIGKDITDSAVEHLVFESIEDTMRDSAYKDWLLRLGYENCMYLNEGGSFLAVLDDGKIMSGGNIMIVDTVWNSVSELYFNHGLEQGEYNDYTLFELSSEIIEDEEEFRGEYDTEYLGLSQDDDTLTIVTPERLIRILEHNFRKAEEVRRDINASIEKYPGILDVIGEQPVAPAFDRPFKTDQDSGYKEYGLVRCDYRESDYVEVTNYFYKDRDSGRYVPLLPFPVSTFSLGKIVGGKDSSESTRVVNGVLTGEFLMKNDEKVGFVSDLESKVSFFFKDGVEYSMSEFEKRFLKGKTNGLGV